MALLFKDAGDELETRWQAERRMRYDYLQKFRDAGGRFDIKYIIEDAKPTRMTLEKFQYNQKKGRRLAWLTKALKRGENPVTAVAAEKLLSNFHPDKLDAEEATKIGLELYLQDVKYFSRIQTEEE
jgi:hypothetical protein